MFGDLTHAECAYIHDLRALMMHEDYYHKRWRLNHHLERNGNFYTTHGLYLLVCTWIFLEVTT